jgi:hypothetical protein
MPMYEPFSKAYICHFLGRFPPKAKNNGFILFGLLHSRGISSRSHTIPREGICLVSECASTVSASKSISAPAENDFVMNDS